MKKYNSLQTDHQLAQRQPTLEEIDAIMRKSRTLHDQEIANTIARWFGKKEKSIGYHHIDGHHQPA